MWSWRKEGPGEQGTGSQYACTLQLTRGVGLVLYAGLVKVVPADGAGIGADRPRPHGHGVPLLHLEPLAGSLAFALPILLLLLLLHLRRVAN